MTEKTEGPAPDTDLGFVMQSAARVDTLELAQKIEGELHVLIMALTSSMSGKTIPHGLMHMMGVAASLFSGSAKTGSILIEPDKTLSLTEAVELVRVIRSSERTHQGGIKPFGRGVLVADEADPSPRGEITPQSPPQPVSTVSDDIQPHTATVTHLFVKSKPSL